MPSKVAVLQNDGYIGSSAVVMLMYALSVE